ncbi:MAG TPA: antibiotic biosynthesis monooxygenase [Steroidobacteraceae bacterium]|nr:antibiotic biosynthesis monooxygenase [Steroidobacteraceae bacterium]
MPRTTFISRMTVKPGREQDFVDVCSELVEQVRRNEPGVIYYEFFKLREPRRYAVLESFPSDEAEHAHMSSAWVAEAAPRIVDCLEGTWVREYLDEFKA